MISINTLQMQLSILLLLQNSKQNDVTVTVFTNNNNTLYIYLHVAQFPCQEDSNYNRSWADYAIKKRPDLEHSLLLSHLNIDVVILMADIGEACGGDCK